MFTVIHFKNILNIHFYIQNIKTIYLNVVYTLFLCVHHKKTIIQILLCPPSKIKYLMLLILHASRQTKHKLENFMLET